MWLLLFLMLDLRIPEPLPKGTPEPPLAIKTQVIEGRYLVTSKGYKSTALIVRPPDTQLYIVYQYTGATVLKGIGFMDGDRFVIGWEHDKSIGVSSIRFRDGNGECRWVSNPGTKNVASETWRLIDAEE